MDVITIESKAFFQIIDKLKKLEDNFTILKSKADNQLSETWLDSSDVLIILKISKRTLQTLRDNNSIPYSQIGKKMYFKATDIEKYLKRNYNGENLI